MINSIYDNKEKKMILSYRSAVRLVLLTGFLLVAASSVLAQSVTITTTALKEATIGFDYVDSVRCQNTEVLPRNMVWTVTGSLPAWVDSTKEIDAGGGVYYYIIYGQPDALGSTSFNLEADDTTPSHGQDNVDLTLTVVTKPVITVTSLPPWTRNAEIPYLDSITVTDGSPEYVFEIIAGALPSGLSLDTATGFVSGMPTAIYDSTFDISVTDANLAADSETVSIVINATMTFAGGLTLANGEMGTAYTDAIDLTASTGTGTKTFAEVGSTLASLGLSLNSSTGQITGTPTSGTVGAATVNIAVTDQGGDSLTGGFFLTIEAPPIFDSTNSCNDTLQNILEGDMLCALDVIEYNNDVVTFTKLFGDFPTGISLNTNGTFNGFADYAINAAPGDLDTFDVRVQACDPGGLCDTLEMRFIVANKNQPPTVCDDSTSWVQTVAQGSTPAQLCAQDLDGDIPTFNAQSSVPNNLSLNSNGSWSGTLAFNIDGWRTVNVNVQDGNGGSFTKVCSLFVAPDTDPPFISTPLARSAAGVVTVGLTDSLAGVDTAYFFWRLGNSAPGDPGTKVDMTPTDTTGFEVTYQATVTDAGLATYGMEIQLFTQDNRVPTNDTTFEWQSVQIPFASGTNNISSGSWLGANDTLWHMVSFTGDYGAGADVHNVFETLSGFPQSSGTDTTDTWRIVDVISGQPVPLSSVANANTVKKGEGYWFRQFRDAFTLRMPAGATAVTTTPFTVTLTPGWNLVGSPYRFAVRLDTASLNSANITSFIGANPAAPGAARSVWTKPMVSVGSGDVQMSPWQGYAMFCEGGSNCMLTIDPHYGMTKSPALAKTTAGGWTVDIQVFSNGRLKDVATIGHSILSSDGPDIYDIRPGGFIGGNSDVVLKNDGYGEFARDIRAGSSLQKWTLDIGQAVSRGSLSWTKVDLDEGEALVLRDVVMDRVIDMTASGTMVVGSPEQLPSGRFLIYYGDADEVWAASRGPASTMPISYNLYQNYPNPFNPSTTLLFDVPKNGHVTVEIFNVLGQKVRTVADETFVAGSHSIEWDGRSDKNDTVASGVYFARMVADNFSKSVTMMLIK